MERNSFVVDYYYLPATYVILHSVRSVCRLMMFSGNSSRLIFLVLILVMSIPDPMQSITRAKVPSPE